MADTFQTVSWSLGADARRSGYMCLAEGYESTEELLRESIRRLSLEHAMRSEFLDTKPLWYGLCIDSPLTKTQCSLLRDVLTELARMAPHQEQDFTEFIRALTDSIVTGERLNVELSPPGHVDMGWVTTFVHCPRCKAEGPVKRWQESYSEDPLECTACGCSYAPAATHSVERERFAKDRR
jgi:hypothetical protein